MAALTLRSAAATDGLPLLLAAVGWMALALGGFVVVAPNRLLSGSPLSLWQAAGTTGLVAVAAPLVAMAGLALARPFAGRHALLGLAAGALIIASTAFAGLAATSQAQSAGPLTRVSLGAGYWWLVAAGFFALADAVTRSRTLPGKALPLVATGLGLALLVVGGMLSELSIAREYAVRRSVFLNEMLRHLELTGAGLLIAVLVGGAIGVMAYRRPRSAGPAFAVLDIVQTIPSIALFAMLIGPLTALTMVLPVLRELGVGGIGAFPAILALALYGLLPVARGVHAGLMGVPAPVVDAARGMGMTQTQIFARTLVPLALPTLLQTLRITLVQLIGLATLAALIGAGGLGTFIFQGLGQTANDLVLLGALSVIVLALLADLGLRVPAALLSRGKAR